MKFCVSLTTIPSRLEGLNKTIKSINSQTIKADKILLNIPIEYKRFNEKIDENKLKKIKENPNIIINRTIDYGPATKLLGSLKFLQNYDYVIILDDDHKYNKKMFEIFRNSYLQKKSNYSFYVQQIFDLSMGQGADGILIKTDILNEIMKFYNKFIINNKNLFLNDDLSISMYINYIKHDNILDISKKFKEETNKNLVYEVHTTINSLKDILNKNFLNRRKIAKIEIIKFKIKKYLNRIF